MRERLLQRWRNTSLKENIYIAAVLYFLLLMFLYSICRLLFYAFNTTFFSGMTISRMTKLMLGGLKFDISGIVYTNILFFVLLLLPLNARFRSGYRRALFIIFVLINSLALATNIIDSVYYPFTLRRTTISIFSQFKNEQNKGALAWQFLVDYWYAFLIFAALVWLMVKLYRRIHFNGPRLTSGWKHYPLAVFAFAAGIGLMVAGARGGFRYSTRPITLSNAAAYSKDPKDVNIVLNTPFAFLRTLGTTQIHRSEYFATAEELNAAYTPVTVPADSLPFKADNVVIFILESFSKEFVGVYNQHMDRKTYKGYTPFLDSLIGESRAYQLSMANGRKSIDAMPAVFASIPSIEIPFISSHYSNNKINSLPSLLKEKGYYSAFFHGAPNGSMGFDAFAMQSGFDDYFGKTEYNNDADYDGIWGIWDHKFFNFFANKLNTFKQPFMAGLFSVSSHHPYELPDEYKKVFTGGDRPIYKTIQYTDYSLRKFFEVARTMPWFKNTLFVFTADHASAEIAYPQYSTIAGYFAIPVFFYKPGETGNGFNRDTMIQQIDIMPTVLGQLHYNKPYVAFGRDIFKPGTHPFVFNYVNNNYQLFEDSSLLLFDGSQTKGLYNFRTDTFFTKNLQDAMPAKVLGMERRLKAIVQQYNNRMVDDDLTTEGSQMKKARVQ